MIYEFNNWEALYQMLEFVKKRHCFNYPTYCFEVPLSIISRGWGALEQSLERIERYKPDDLTEMSIYGWIKFDVTKDENLNNEYWRNK